MWGDWGWGSGSCPPSPHGLSHPGPAAVCAVGWRRGAGCHDRCPQPAGGAGQLTGNKNGRTDGRTDGQAGSSRARGPFPVLCLWGSSRGIYLGTIEVPDVGNSHGEGEGDSVTESSFRFPALRYRLDCSQGWLLMGRGRWHCPGSVGTIFRGALGRGIPKAALPSSSPRKTRAPACSTNFPGGGGLGGELPGGEGWGGPDPTQHGL